MFLWLYASLDYIIFKGLLWLKKDWATVQEFRRKVDLRAGKGYQSSTDHNKVQDVPQVTKIRTRVQEQSQVNHLESKKKEKK